MEKKEESQDVKVQDVESAYDKTLFEKYDYIMTFDVETTGLDSINDRIIEFGGIIMQKTGFSRFNHIALEKDILVKQDKPIPEEIVSLTGITNAELAENGQDESDVADFADVAFATGNRTLVIGYNVGFDLCFLNQLMRRERGNEWKFNGDVIDVMAIYRDHYHYSGKKMPNGKKYGHSLSAAVERLGIPVKNTHRSVDDARATWEVFKRLYIIYKDFRPYLNRFGYNPKFGPAYAPLNPKDITYEKFDKVEYVPQDAGGAGKEMLTSYNQRKSASL
jgi:DNA polymerase-3 subunit epsilon